MAYISQETKKELAPAIKAVLKKYNMKGSIGIDRHTSLRVRVTEGPLKFDDYEQVNTSWIEKFYGEGTKETAFLTELVAAMKGTKWYNNSDYMTDYFDVAYWIDVHIGRWDKPYIQTAQREVNMSNIYNETAKEAIYDTIMEMTVEDFLNTLEFDTTIVDKIEMAVETLVEKNFEEMCEQGLT